jgi:hypothetical protein
VENVYEALLVFSTLCPCEPRLSVTGHTSLLKPFITSCSRDQAIGVQIPMCSLLLKKKSSLPTVTKQTKRSSESGYGMLTLNSVKFYLPFAAMLNAYTPSPLPCRHVSHIMSSGIKTFAMSLHLSPMWGSQGMTSYQYFLDATSAYDTLSHSAVSVACHLYAIPRDSWKS